MAEDILNVLVVDDSISYRKIICDIIENQKNVNVVGTAYNGRIAISRIKALKPDLILLDINMPEVDGLDVLKYIKKELPDIGAIIISSVPNKGGETAVKALELGAFDFIPKPGFDTVEENMDAVKRVLLPMMNAFIRRRDIKRVLRKKSPFADYIGGAKASTYSSSDITERMNRISGKLQGRPEVVVIGISTGGPNALATMLTGLPADLNLPILIVQHMPPQFTQPLAESLNDKCPLLVKEAADGDLIAPNTVYIAPGGKQMKIKPGPDDRKLVAITDDPPENSCKPSVDYLFRSVAEFYGGKTIGVIMTGMGTDGTDGTRHIKEKGARIIAQNEATCTVYGMPKQVIESGLADVISPLDDIAEHIVRFVKG